MTLSKSGNVFPRPKRGRERERKGEGESLVELTNQTTARASSFLSFPPSTLFSSRSLSYSYFRSSSSSSSLLSPYPTLKLSYPSLSLFLTLTLPHLPLSLSTPSVYAAQVGSNNELDNLQCTLSVISVLSPQLPHLTTLRFLFLQHRGLQPTGPPPPPSSAITVGPGPGPIPGQNPAHQNHPPPHPAHPNHAAHINNLNQSHSPARLNESLEVVRQEFELVTQDLVMLRAQRDDFENKSTYLLFFLSVDFCLHFCSE